MRSVLPAHSDRQQVGTAEVFSMLDRFTDRARRVMSMAKEEAIALSSTKVGTEHLLLALAKEEGIASEALQSLDISYDDVMDQIKEAAGAATTKPAAGSPAVDASSASSSPRTTRRHLTATAPTAPRAPRARLPRALRARRPMALRARRPMAPPAATPGRASSPSPLPSSP